VGRVGRGAVRGLSWGWWLGWCEERFSGFIAREFILMPGTGMTNTAGRQADGHDHPLDSGTFRAHMSKIRPSAMVQS
jgi:hypothetical protein